MATFFVTALQGSEAVISAAIKAKFPVESIRSIESNKWFVRGATLTAKDVSDLLALGDPKLIPGAGYLILTISGYYGVAQADLWEWLQQPQQPKT